MMANAGTQDAQAAARAAAAAAGGTNKTGSDSTSKPAVAQKELLGQ